MRSVRLRTLALMPAMLAWLALSGCALLGQTTPTTPVVFNCAGRVPPQIRARVKPAPLPTENTVGMWVTFADKQTGKVDEANDRGDTILWIVENCEVEALAAAKSIDRRPWLVRQFRPIKPS